MAKRYTVLSTGELITAIHRAATRGYARAMKPEVMDHLDPEGFHVVSMSMLEDTGPKDLVRCLFFMKYVNDDHPHAGWLDIDLAVFNGYQTMEAV